MSSLSYWEKRKAQEMFQYMAKAEDTADEIAKLYQKSSGYLSTELDKILTVIVENIACQKLRHIDCLIAYTIKRP